LSLNSSFQKNSSFKNYDALRFKYPLWLSPNSDVATFLRWFKHFSMFLSISRSMFQNVLICVLMCCWIFSIKKNPLLHIFISIFQLMSHIFSQHQGTISSPFPHQHSIHAQSLSHSSKSPKIQTHKITRKCGNFCPWNLHITKSACKSFYFFDFSKSIGT